MNTWNRDFVHENYPQQVADFLVPGPDGTVSVRSTPAMNVMGHTVVNDTCDMGWVAAWAAEMGDRATLDGILAHADRFMAPTWADGGLYYPRNDTPSDADGHRTEMEPMTGNVLLGYARLDVPDGLHELYQHPWGPEHFTEPALVEVGHDVEVSRAEVLDGVLHARLRRRGAGDDGAVVIGRVPDDARVRVDGREVETRSVPEGLRLEVAPGSAHDLELVR
jgi:hypothetical protein